MKLSNNVEEDRLIGLRVKALRQKRGITILSLAQKAGLDTSVVNLAEAGLTHFSGATVQRIADVLGVEASEILAESGQCSFGDAGKMKTEICMTVSSISEADRLKPLLDLVRQMKDAE